MWLLVLDAARGDHGSVTPKGSGELVVCAPARTTNLVTGTGNETALTIPLVQVQSTLLGTPGNDVSVTITIKVTNTSDHFVHPPTRTTNLVTSTGNKTALAIPLVQVQSTLLGITGNDVSMTITIKVMAGRAGSPDGICDVDPVGRGVVVPLRVPGH